MNGSQPCGHKFTSQLVNQNPVYDRKFKKNGVAVSGETHGTAKEPAKAAKTRRKLDVKWF